MGRVRSAIDPAGILNRIMAKWEVNKDMQSMGKAIGEITKSSEETSKIIKTIEEIAFQTNLLALNVAEESASASKEMNAQAEKMKVLVGDLVSLVGGANGNGAMSAEEILSSREGHPLEVSGHGPGNGGKKVLFVPGKKGKKEEAVVPKAKGVKPEQLIPMGDGDFKEF